MVPSVQISGTSLLFPQAQLVATAESGPVFPICKPWDSHQDSITAVGVIVMRGIPFVLLRTK